MKKRIVYLSLVLVVLVILTSCSSANSSVRSYLSEPNLTSDASMKESYDFAEEGMAKGESANTTSKIMVNDPHRKLIKNANMMVETKSFDEYITGIQKKTQELGGYVSNLSISDQGYGVYNKNNSYAEIEFRIPVDSLDAFLSEVSEGVNVRNQNISTTDVTLQYSDVESRIKALKTEQDRLLELIAKAESVDAIIVIESRLSEVHYELESYNSQLRLMDNQVQYSTVTMSIFDVQEYQNTKDTSYFEKIRVGFMQNLTFLFHFLSNLFLAIIVSLPTLIFLIVILIVAIFVIKKSKFKLTFGKKKAKKEVLSSQDDSRLQNDPAKASDSFPTPEE